MERAQKAQRRNSVRLNREELWRPWWQKIIGGKNRSKTGTRMLKFRMARHYLHGAGLMIANQRRPPLNADGFRQRHSAVRLVSGEVFQAAWVCLFLPVLSQNMRGRETLLLSSEEHTRSTCYPVILPAALPLQKPVGTRSRLERSPPPPPLWRQGWSEVPRGNVPQRRGPVRRCNKGFSLFELNQRNQMWAKWGPVGYMWPNKTQHGLFSLPCMNGPLEL